jgi:N-carbamoyl-L-amino-acid hydrolase
MITDRLAAGSFLAAGIEVRAQEDNPVTTTATRVISRRKSVSYPPRLNVDADRLREDLETLGRIGRTAGAGITRTSFSRSDMQAREWYQATCRAAGLTVRVDPVGNMFAGAGEHSGAAAVWSGSHIDTVPDGGAFDGAVGAVAALECVRRIAEEGISLSRPVKAVVFTDEEGNYSHLFGSSALTHGFDQEQLGAMAGRDGDLLVDALAAGGWDLGALTDTRVDPESVYAFVELHIEQGPRLEAAGTQVGVVTSIVGLGGAVTEFYGRADHAGTTPMTARQDPLLAAADLIAAMPAIAASVSDVAVATCGRVDTSPGSANVVPSLARLTLDYRDPDAARLGTLGARLEAKAAQAARDHGVRYAWIPDLSIAPAELNPRIRSAIERHARSLGLSTLVMPSGAGHDSQNMATIAPTGMIFVPSKGGRSHCPDEDTDWNDVANGANVLLNTLVELATSGIS